MTLGDISNSMTFPGLKFFISEFHNFSWFPWPVRTLSTWIACPTAASTVNTVRSAQFIHKHSTAQSNQHSSYTSTVNTDVSTVHTVTWHSSHSHLDLSHSCKHSEHCPVSTVHKMWRSRPNWVTLQLVHFLGTATFPKGVPAMHRFWLFNKISFCSLFFSTISLIRKIHMSHTQKVYKCH